MAIPITLATPYQDPPNTFRATSITDMFYIVPNFRKYWNDLDVPGASFIYDVGIDPEVRKLIVTFKNRTVSHTLRVNMTLPPYLRSDIGTEFNVPHIGDTTTPPIQQGVIFYPRIIIETLTPEPADPEVVERLRKQFTPSGVTPYYENYRPAEVNFEGTGKGIVNIVLSFSEAQARIYEPGTFEDSIIFDIFPLDVNGPVFVDETAEIPNDLNEEIGDDDTVPRDDDEITPEEPEGEECPTEPVFIDREVEVPVEVLKWIDGTDGQEKDWPPPPGWEAGNDGRMYPPVPDVGECELDTGTERDLDEIPEGERTPLEQLLFESRDIPPTYGTNTRRRGYVIDADQYLDGFNTGRVAGRTIELLVADSSDGYVEFKIINWKKTFRNGEPVPDPDVTIQPGFDEMRAYFDKSNLYTGFLKEGVIYPGKFHPDHIATYSISRLIENNDKVTVNRDDDFEDLLRKRIWVNTMALLREIDLNGEGKPPSEI